MFYYIDLLVLYVCLHSRHTGLNGSLWAVLSCFFYFPLECVSFFLCLNHKCVRIAWLNFPYCPYALDSTEFLRRENCVLFFFLFVVFSHFPFVIGATNCLCTFVSATIVACRCHTYNHVNLCDSCMFFYFCFYLSVLLSRAFVSLSLFHFFLVLSIFLCFYLCFIFPFFVILNECFQR